MTTWVVGDFETASTCDLKKCGAWRYAEDPTTEVLCFAYQVKGGAVQVWRPGQEPGDLLALVNDPAVIFIAHNTAFEKAIWRHIMVAQFSWPDIPNDRWHDTQAVCAMKVIPLDLERAALVLRLPHEKDTDGRKLTLSLSKPDKHGYFDRSDDSLNRVSLYCQRDIDAEVSLHRRLGWLPGPERQIWLLDQKINERGVALDLDYVHAAQRIVDRASGPLLSEFAQITGGLKPTQVAKYQNWMHAKNVHLDNLRKETLDQILGQEREFEDDEPLTGDDDEDAQRPDHPVRLPADVHRSLVIRNLIGSSSIKKLGRMAQCVGFDGRARGLLQYHGTLPGRWAGRLLQPQNFPRGTIKIGGSPVPVDLVVAAIMTGDPEYVQMMVGPPVETVVSGLRHAIVAGRGKTIVSGDYAGIQARVVLALAGEHEKTAMMAAGKDIYIDMAEQIYKRPIDKKKDPAERQTGKNSVLGLGFQMGARKFSDKYCADQSFEFAEHVVQVYRKEWAPGVPKLWYGLEGAAVRAVWDRKPVEFNGCVYQVEDAWLSCRLPSGRKIWYFNPQPVKKVMLWDDTDVRLGFTYQAMKMGQWKTIHAFGGQLTENVVCGIERDILVDGMFKCENNGLPVILNVHDELVTEPDAGGADEQAMQQMMLDVPQWVKDIRIPIGIETWQGDRYRK